ncbi:MAG: cytochrome c-type biogenesis protein CcmH [Actinomycetes bacterium]
MAAATSARRTRLGWVLLAIVVLGALGWALWPRSGPESVAAHTRRLAREFRCVDCEGLSVAESATASARAARADIRRRIEAGESDADIRGVFVARYGESVLLNPQGRGIGLIVWALPVLLVLLGAAGIAAAVRRGRTPRLAATAEDEAIVARARDRGEGP